MVRVRELPNKPLVEAICELRWRVDPEKGDPNYSLFVGRLYSQLDKKYKFHQQLPASMIPEQLAGSIPQHMFRVGKDEWPLIQVGPGLVTLNETEKYTWPDFNERSKELINAVFKAYPKPEEMKVTNLFLRYIDAIKIDGISSNILNFVKDKLKVELFIPENLYEGEVVVKRPRSFNFNITHNTKKPKGIINLKLSSGMQKGHRAIILELVVLSEGNDVPVLPNYFSSWIKDAHKITDDWFFKLIEGELEHDYAGDT